MREVAVGEAGRVEAVGGARRAEGVGEEARRYEITRSSTMLPAELPQSSRRRHRRRRN